jgi:flagellar motor protein MotB
MRGASRRPGRDEEEESAFVSMTDMTVSFLFIVMILLAFFAARFSSDDVVPRAELDAAEARIAAIAHERDEVRRVAAGLRELLRQALSDLREARTERDAAQERIAELEDLLSLRLRELDEALMRRDGLLRLVARLRATMELRRVELEQAWLRVAELEERLEQLDAPDPLEEYMARAADTRLLILQDLRRGLRVRFPGVQVEISEEGDALRFQGEGLFGSGQSRLQSGPRQIVEAIAESLNEILPCYTLGEGVDWDDGCNPNLAVIEAVQIEGHTDSDGSELDNLDLSTARSNATFGAMVLHVPTLTGHLNYRNQPVLSVAGYGEMRPVATNETPEGRATNRRIDIRIIMHTPGSSEEILLIAERFQEAMRSRAE